MLTFGSLSPASCLLYEEKLMVEVVLLEQLVNSFRVAVLNWILCLGRGSPGVLHVLLLIYLFFKLHWVFTAAWASCWCEWGCLCAVVWLFFAVFLVADMGSRGWS